ncbi:MAG: hypothetical protein R3Y19_05905 [Rikenellaceae bacterium]
MKRTKVLISLLCGLFLLSLTSCEVFRLRTYVIVQSSPSSSNYTYNTQLQYAVASELASINSTSSYVLRNEEDAIDWFYSVCSDLESSYFPYEYDIPVWSGSTTTLKLLGDGDVAATSIMTIRFSTNTY